jgi:hypothetical protein
MSLMESIKVSESENNAEPANSEILMLAISQQSPYLLTISTILRRLILIDAA